MKQIGQLGTPLVSYEGVGDVTVEEDSNRLESRGYFEASHLSSGRVAVGFVPNDRRRPSRIELRADPNCELSFVGQDFDGWNLKTIGRTLFSRISWLLMPTAIYPTALNFSAQYIEATRRGASETGYHKSRFLVSSLLWDSDSGEEPEPFQLEVHDFEVEVIPVDDYIEVAHRLRNMHGVEPTAHVWIRSSHGELLPLESYRGFLDNLLHVFRLVTGNQVNWYYGEAIDENSVRPVERVHKYALTRPYSNTIRFRPLKSGMMSAIPKLSPHELTRAFFDDSGQSLDRAAVKALIDQFTMSCDETSYLESKGLLASTLTELIASKIAYANGVSDAIPHSNFVKETLPILSEAVENTQLPKEIKEHVKNQLQGAYRNTFRHKLRSLNDRLKLGLNRFEIARVVDVRNALVHEGTYRSDFDDGGWVNDYQFTTWVNFIALCRLLGYDGELPVFGHGQWPEV